MAKGHKRHKRRVIVGYDSSGAPIIKWAAGATRTQMEQRARQLEYQYVTGAEKVSKADISFGDYALQWFKTYKVGPGTLKASTLQGYRIALNAHILPYWGNRRIRAIKPLELQSWVNGFAGAREGTVHAVLFIIRQIFTQALTDGTIDRNPMTGIRKPRTVALDRETKRPVLTNVLKSPSAMRGGTLPDDVLAQLKIHRSRQLQQRMKAGAIWHDHNLIFPDALGFPRNPAAFSAALGRLGRKALGRHVGSHAFRHMLCTALINAGVSVRL